MTSTVGRSIAWAAFGLSVSGSLGSAWAQVPGDDKSKCGTTAFTQPARSRPESPRPVPVGAVAGGAHGPGSGLVPGNLLTPPTQLPGVGERELPEPATTQAGSTPPTSPGPPALPGLPPGQATAVREDDEQRRSRVEAIQAKGEVPEERLLDIGIQVFDAGLSEADRDRLAEKGLSPELRRSESRFLAFHLKRTLEGTGNWGAVRVVPGPGEGIDVFVSGKIVESNGKRLALEVNAADATGRRWFQRRYRGVADTSAYRPDRVGQHEPFQEVYNRIANDLLEAREGLKASELVGLRRVSAMRFAAEIAPAAFASYLKSSGEGRYALVRLPAEDDPMLRRVAAVRERDQMLVDTLNEHYVSFYERMTLPYGNWRQYSYQEQAALDKINRESLLKKILGGAAVVAGLMMDGSSQAESVAQTVAVVGGMAAIQSGFEQGKEKSMHVAALKELATSFDAEVAPLLVEVEGQQLKLTGSAEKQFSEWQEMLQRVFTLEAGQADPNAPIQAATPPRSR